MADPKQFKLPDVGEGLTEGEILKWYVQPGDTVTVNQTLVEIETAKAAVELPSPYAGVVTELHFAEGAMVDVGMPIITIDTDPGGSAVPAAPAAAATGADQAGPSGRPDDLVPHIPVPAEDEAVEPGLTGGPAPGGRTSVLVGYGPRTTAAARRPRKSSVASGPAEPMGHRPSGAGGKGQGSAVLAKPPVRKLAKDLGVDLRTVRPSGPGATVTREDVEAAAAMPAAACPPAVEPAAPAVEPGAAPAASGERRIPVRGVRRMTAQAVVASAFTAPHVTEFLTVDVTRTMRLARRLGELPDFAGQRISPLLLVAKALLVAVRRSPDINATWDEAAQEIVLKEQVNLGIAAATPRGLVVPNIKAADRLRLPELAAALAELVQVARDGKTAPADLTGGTITITNVGVFGVDTGTPILNPGEAAILAFGAVREMPWVHKGKVKPRRVTTLALSFDHRLVDGELGSKVLADVGTVLEDPTVALAWS